MTATVVPADNKESVERLTAFASYINNRLAHGTKKLTDEERDWLYARFTWGEKQYGEAFKTRDLVREMREELADALVYMFLISIKNNRDYDNVMDGVEFSVTKALQLTRGMKDE